MDVLEHFYRKIHFQKSLHQTLLIAALLFLGLLSERADAAGKLALVIGNSNYEHVSKLRNPANDADLISSKLKEIGFEVVGAKDLTRIKTEALIQEFADKIRTIGKDGIVMFYYAGHGIQFRGENFIVPVNANLQSDSDIILQGINSSVILKIIELSGAKTNIIVLDACRNNPFVGVSRSVGQGLARMKSPSGSIIAYSTAPGQVALDGTGKNSPYSEALAEFITKPDLTLEAVFKNVRRKVYYATDQAQTPWEETSLVDEVYLADRGLAASTQQPQKPKKSASLVQEENFWNQIKDKADPDLFQTYLNLFPEGKYREIALAQLPKAGDATASLQPKTQNFDYSNEELEAQFSKFNAILNLLTDKGTQRAVMSYDRYRSWCCKSLKKGPTGKERYIAYGLYELFPINWEDYKRFAKLDEATAKIMEQNKASLPKFWSETYSDLPLRSPSFDNLDNAVAGMINAYKELYPINQQAARYYTNEMYNFDQGKGAKIMHQGLFPAFENFIEKYQHLAGLVLLEMEKIKTKEIDYVALKTGKSWEWFGVREHYYLLQFTLEFLNNRDLDKTKLKSAYSKYVANFLETSDFSTTAPPPPQKFAGLVSNAGERVKKMKDILAEKGKRDWSMHMDVSGWFD